MKITYITADYYPENNAGVARSKSYIEEMLKRGYDVEVFASAGSVSIGCERIRTSFSKSPQNTKSFSLRMFREFLFVSQCIFILFFTHKERVLVVSSPPFMLLVIPILFGSKFRSILLDVRDIYPDVIFDSGVLVSQSLIGRFLRRFEKKSYECSSKVVTVCSSLLGLISSRTSNTNLYLVHNGYPDSFYKLQREPAPCGSGDINVFCHGNFGRFQNIEFLIDVALVASFRLPNVRFHFVGFGSRFSYFKSKAGENCSFFDAVDQDSLLNMLKIAHIGISARTDDFVGNSAMPVKVLEYLGLDIPVISLPIIDELRRFEVDSNIYQFDYSDGLDKVVALLKRFLDDEVVLKNACDSAEIVNFKRSGLSIKFCDILEES